MQRRVIGELMDAPDVDPAEHRRALDGLRRINRVSRAASIMTQPILRHLRKRGQAKIRMLDVASGGGDVPLKIAQILRSHGIDVDLTFFDQSDVGLAGALRQAKLTRISASAETGDALNALPKEAYDLTTCSLFLHHLTREQCIAALVQMRAATNGLIVVSDLVRSRLGLLGAVLGCRLLSRSPLVHHDGPASVRAAWTPGELYDLASCAGLHRAVIQRCFPARMLLVAPVD